MNSAPVIVGQGCLPRMVPGRDGTFTGERHVVGGGADAGLTPDEARALAGLLLDAADELDGWVYGLLTFDQARRIVNDNTGEPTCDYGWQNSDVFVVPIDYSGRETPLGEGVPVVDKRTGTVRWVNSHGFPAADNLRPIGNPPD